MATDETADYFGAAQGWEADRLARAERWARRSGWLAGAGWVAVLALSLALASLAPLKRVEPFLIRVDNTTGVVDVVPSAVDGAAMPETVTRYLLTHYTLTCERFTAATAESDYQECGAFNTSARNQQWSALWNTSNPASPLNKYRDGTTVQAQVRSVSFFARANGLKDLAQVRFVRAERPSGSGAEHVTPWIATVQYVYAEPATDPKRRLLNPLGFRVVEFRVEPEAPSAADRAGGATP
jgi:type IV secretion system protein VirB8